MYGYTCLTALNLIHLEHKTFLEIASGPYDVTENTCFLYDCGNCLQFCFNKMSNFSREHPVVLLRFSSIVVFIKEGLKIVQ